MLVSGSVGLALGDMAGGMGPRLQGSVLGSTFESFDERASCVRLGSISFLG